MTIDDPVHLVGQPDGVETPGRFTTIIGGLHTTPALIAHEGYQHGIQLDLSPLAARALFGLPAGALPRGAVELDTVLGPQALELWERVAEATGWAERFDELDRSLARRLIDGAGSRQGVVAPELDRAWTLLHSTGGAITVNELAAETGWSRRHLSARFRDEFGLPPKVVGRVIRFDRARRSLPQRRGDLAMVAAECGYADQAHMIRDFHDFCGCSPTEWLAEEYADDPTLLQLVTV